MARLIALAHSSKNQSIVTIGSPVAQSLIPDGFFGLHFFKEEQESYFMYEKDRGEMPIERRKNLQGTYIAKKLRTYYEARRQRHHVHELGIPNFRVLVETTTPERVEQMLEALNEITGGKGSNISLFTDEQALAACNPLDVLWITGKINQIKITDSKTVLLTIGPSIFGFDPYAEDSNVSKVVGLFEPIT